MKIIKYNDMYDQNLPNLLIGLMLREFVSEEKDLVEKLRDAFERISQEDIPKLEIVDVFDLYGVCKRRQFEVCILPYEHFFAGYILGRGRPLWSNSAIATGFGDGNKILEANLQELDSQIPMVNNIFGNLSPRCGIRIPSEKISIYHRGVMLP